MIREVMSLGVFSTSTASQEAQISSSRGPETRCRARSIGQGIGGAVMVYFPPARHP
jgi:hypothetical protein